MDLKKLNNEEIVTLLNDIELAEKNNYIKEDSLLRLYMNSLNNQTLALVQAPIDIWKEAAHRWKNEKEFPDPSWYFEN